jgi:hypothetical protein
MDFCKFSSLECIVCTVPTGEWLKVVAKHCLVDLQLREATIVPEEPPDHPPPLALPRHRGLAFPCAKMLRQLYDAIVAGSCWLDVRQPRKSERRKPPKPELKTPGAVSMD